jgi:hypothetical protein
MDDVECRTGVTVSMHGRAPYAHRLLRRTRNARAQDSSNWPLGFLRTVSSSSSASSTSGGKPEGSQGNRPIGAENLATLWCMRILVDQAAEPVPAQNAHADLCCWRVRPVSAEMVSPHATCEYSWRRWRALWRDLLQGPVGRWVL